MNTDVLVAGAGPVGLAMAVGLARYGVSVRIVDKAAQRTDKSKALVLWSRTLELLDSAGCSRPLSDAGCKVSAVEIVEGIKQIAHVSLAGVASPHPYALMLPQSETERLLDEHLNGLGVQVERSVELIQFAASADQVISTLRHADGHDEKLETAWLIGCDGAHSTVRHQLGMEFVGDTMPSNWILADVHLSNVPWKREVVIAWHADGRAGNLSHRGGPIPDHRRRRECSAVRSNPGRGAGHSGPAWSRRHRSFGGGLARRLWH